MSNARKLRKHTPRICPDCASGKHTGRPHAIDGSPQLCQGIDQDAAGKLRACPDPATEVIGDKDAVVYLCARHLAMVRQYLAGLAGRN